MSSLSRVASLALAAAAAVTLVACGTTTRYVSTNPPPRQMRPRPVETVQVFATSRPSSPYVEVGILQARQSSGFSSDKMPDIIKAMREEAAKKGCDGIIISGPNDKTVGSESDSATTVTNKNRSTTSYSHSSSTETLEGYWGACIMYTTVTPPFSNG